MKLFEDFYTEVRIDEVTDRANINIDWNWAPPDISASFKAAAEKFNVSVEESGAGYFTITFSNTGGYAQTGKAGNQAVAVFSGVLTTLREFTERYEEEMEMKPYQFDFSAAYEIPMNHELYQELKGTGSRSSLYARLETDVKRELLKTLISRPMLYYALSLTFGKSYGYTTDMSDSWLDRATGAASDFRSVRKNVTKFLNDLDDSGIDKALQTVSRTGNVSFTLTNNETSSYDYTHFGVLSIEDSINDADYDQVYSWISDGQEDEILEYADWRTLVRIAEWGLMHDILILNDDEDVRRAVVSTDPDMAERLVTSEDPEHRKHAIELGYGAYELSNDDDSDVRENAWDYAFGELDSDERISILGYLAGRGSDYADEFKDRMIDEGEAEERVAVVETGYRIIDLLDDDEEEVRTAAINNAFEYYEFSGRDAAEQILTSSNSYAQENFEYVMSGNFGPITEDEFVEFAREMGLDVSEYEDEDEDE